LTGRLSKQVSIDFEAKKGFIFLVDFICPQLYTHFQCNKVSGFHQVALQLGPNGLRPQGLEEYSDDYLASDNLGPVMGSKYLVMQTTGNYLGLGPSEETLERMFQVATWTFNLLYCFPFMYTH
jgi:hypothetical protein